MISSPSPCVRFSRRARVRSAAMDSAGVSSMKKFRCSSSWLTGQHAVEVRSLISSPLRIFSEGISACSEIMRVASCSADISSEKKPTTAPSATFGRAVLAMLLAIGLGGIEGDVGGERGLSHRRSAGEDDEVGPVQAAEQLVELEQTRGHAGQLADPVIGRFGRDRGLGQGRPEGPEAALDLARSWRGRRASFPPARSADRASVVDVAAEGAVDHALAERRSAAGGDRDRAPCGRKSPASMTWTEAADQPRQIARAAGRLHAPRPARHRS